MGESVASLSDILISGPNYNDNNVIEFKSSFESAVLTLLSENRVGLNSKVYFRDRYENTLNKLTGKIPFASSQEKHQIKEKMMYFTGLLRCFFFTYVRKIEFWKIS